MELRSRKRKQSQESIKRSCRTDVNTVVNDVAKRDTQHIKWVGTWSSETHETSHYRIPRAPPSHNRHSFLRPQSGKHVISRLSVVLYTAGKARPLDPLQAPVGRPKPRRLRQCEP